MGLFQKDECGACKAKDDIISFLKEEISKERKERLDERAEFKRTVDLLLMKNNVAPVGQGVIEPNRHTMEVDLDKALGFMAGVGDDMSLEEIEEEKRRRSIA